MSTPSRNLTILGSTGSIGVNTLRVVSQHPGRFTVHALTAHRNMKLLAEQCRIFTPRHAVVMDAGAAGELQQLLQMMSVSTEVSYGAAALAAVAEASAVDTVMAAIVGGAGLLPTLAAARAGKKVLLANKESLVMAVHAVSAQEWRSDPPHRQRTQRNLPMPAHGPLGTFYP